MWPYCNCQLHFQPTNLDHPIRDKLMIAHLFWAFLHTLIFKTLLCYQNQTIVCNATLTKKIVVWHCLEAIKLSMHYVVASWSFRCITLFFYQTLFIYRTLFKTFSPKTSIPMHCCFTRHHLCCITISPSFLYPTKNLLFWFFVKGLCTFVLITKSGPSFVSSLPCLLPTCHYSYE